MKKLLLMMLLCCSLYSLVPAQSFKAIIFDMDGVIVDSEPFWFRMLLTVLSQHGVSLDESEEKIIHTVMHGNPINATFAWAKQYYGISKSVDELVSDYWKSSEHHFIGNIPLVPGFERFFKKVSNYSFCFAVASNCDTFSMNLVRKSQNLDLLFGEHLYTRDLVQNPKPAPDVYLYAAEKIGVAPHECIVIEDSPTGIAAAQAAGMFCIGLNRGNPDKVQKAHHIVNSFDEIDIDLLMNSFLK